MKYVFIQEQSIDYKVARLITILGVSVSGYYDWLKRPERPCSKKHRELVSKIKVLHDANYEVYDSPRAHRELVDYSEQVGVNCVARLMRENGIKSKMAKRFVITTGSKSTMDAAPDYLKNHFATNQKNDAWVSDTNFIAIREGWLHLVQDA